ncbi:MAG: BspA family leucine-rich repeat surface protein, partial [Bacilli bacterium]|nr:BspA family leucine-rich repeat surface protein [Bacilli bacterium]
DSLKAGQTRKIKVRVKYRDDLNPEDLPTEDKSIDLSFQVTYVQADERVTKSTPSIMAAGTLKTNVDSSKITKIEFKVDEEIPTTAIDSWDVSQNQDESVMAYIEDDKTGNGTYKVTIVGDGNVTANENSSGMFSGFRNLKELDLSNLDTSQVTNMQGMFASCNSLTSIDLSNINLSNVTNMEAMFASCNSLTSIDLSNINLSNVTNMEAMFASCNSLTSIDLNNKDLSNVTSMSNMFMGDSNLTRVNFSNINLSSVTNMSGMFGGCSNLTSMDLSNTNLSSVTNMSGMFGGCNNLTTTITIKSSNITNYHGMFNYAATNSDAKITVNYTEETSSLVDQMIATKSENSNVVKGSLVSN